MSRSFHYFIAPFFLFLLFSGCTTEQPKKEETTIVIDSTTHTNEIESIGTSYFENGKCTYRPSKPIPTLLEKLPQLVHKDFFVRFPKLVNSLKSISRAYDASNYSSDGLFTKTYPAHYKSEGTLFIDFGLMEPYTLVLLTDQFDAEKNQLPYETMNHEQGTLHIHCTKDTSLLFYNHENELIATYIATNSTSSIDMLETNYFDGAYIYDEGSSMQSIIIKKSTILADNFHYSSIALATDLVTGIPLRSDNAAVSDIVSLQDGEQVFWFDLIRKDKVMEFYNKRKIEEDGLDVNETLVQEGLVFRLNKQR